MPKYRVYGTVVGSKYLGEYEAESAEEAKEMAQAEAYSSLCYHCSSECEDPEITQLYAETD